MDMMIGYIYLKSEAILQAKYVPDYTPDSPWLIITTVTGHTENLFGDVAKRVWGALERNCDTRGMLIHPDDTDSEVQIGYNSQIPFKQDSGPSSLSGVGLSDTTGVEQDTDPSSSGADAGTTDPNPAR